MSEESSAGVESAKFEAVQAVVDRVSSYQESAPEGMIAKELADGLSEAGVELSEADVSKLVDAIEADGGAVSAEGILS